LCGFESILIACEWRKLCQVFSSYWHTQEGFAACVVTGSDGSGFVQMNAYSARVGCGLIHDVSGVMSLTVHPRSQMMLLKLGIPALASLLQILQMKHVNDLGLSLV